MVVENRQKEEGQESCYSVYDNFISRVKWLMMRRSRAECNGIDQSFWSWMITVFAENKDGKSRGLGNRFTFDDSFAVDDSTIPSAAI